MSFVPAAPNLKDARRVKRAERVIKPMLLWFGLLQTYRVSVSFTDQVEGRACAIAEVVDDWPYRSVLISYQRQWFDLADDEGLEEKTLHEILHPLLFMHINTFLSKKDVNIEEFRDLEEDAVDAAAMWLWRLHRDPKWTPL